MVGKDTKLVMLMVKEKCMNISEQEEVKRMSFTEKIY